MTIKYWNTLEEGSKYRALKYVYPLYSDSLIKGYLKDKPQPKKDCFWEIAWRYIRIPEDNSHYKTVVHNVYIM